MSGLNGYDQWKTASPYDDDPGYDHANLEDAVKALNEGRNLDCWPLCSFGWKDADLDPCGCTGIKAIGGDLSTNHPKLTVEVGGHKTVCHPNDWWLDLSDEKRDEFGEIVQELVIDMGGPGEWTGDDWCLYFSDTIKVDPVWDETDMELDYTKTAEVIVKAARQRCGEWSREMRELDKLVEEVYQEAKKEEVGQP